MFSKSILIKIRNIILPLLMIHVPVVAEASNWNSGGSSFQVEAQTLNCEFQKYENSGYKISVAKSWIRENQTHIFNGMGVTYPDRSVDCVLDKATLDTMKQLDDEDDEDDMEFSAPGASDKAVKPDPRSHAQRMLRESCRVLKPGGHYVCITYGEPQTRLPLFDPNNEGLGEWENAAGGDENDGSPYLELKRNKATYYVYVFRKRTDASLVAEQVVSELVDDSVTAAERTFKE